jgi:hypothetical protein
MNILFRIKTLQKILSGDYERKKANTVMTDLKKKAEIYSDVIKSLKEKGFEEEKKEKAKKNEPKYTGKITIPGVKSGVTVKVPDNPIIDGKYNVYFQIRHGRNPTKSGVNTIIVEAEAGGMGSSENTAAFGNANWVKQQLGTIHSVLTKHFGDDISLGKLGFGSFSGGYDALGNILRDKELSNKIDSVVVLDGIHYGQRGKPNPVGMQPWVEYAEKAKNDPSKKFVFVYTAVDPGKYASTSDSANYIMNQLNVNKKSTPEDYKNFGGVKPATIGSSGGFHAIQLYDRKTDKLGYGYTPKEMKQQHINAAKAMPDVLHEYLYEDWNT